MKHKWFAETRGGRCKQLLVMWLLWLLLLETGCEWFREGEDTGTCKRK